jgi:hypothetical protein
VHAVVFVHLPPLHLVLASPLILEDLEVLDASSESVVVAHPEFFNSILMTNFQAMGASTLSLA